MKFMQPRKITRPGNSVGLLKTSDAKISCDLSIKSAANAAVADHTVATVPLPLRCVFKTKETKINEVLVTPSSNESHLQSYIAFLTCEVPSGYEDSKIINMCYLDAHGHMDDITHAHSGAIARRDLCLGRYTRN